MNIWYIKATANFKTKFNLIQKNLIIFLKKKKILIFENHDHKLNLFYNNLDPIIGSDELSKLN